MIEENVKLELRGHARLPKRGQVCASRLVPAADYDRLSTLCYFLFGLTDVKTPEKKAARWALDRAVTLLAQLKSEVGGIR